MFLTWERLARLRGIMPKQYNLGFERDEWDLIAAALLEYVGTEAETTQCMAMVMQILRVINDDDED